MNTVTSTSMSKYSKESRKHFDYLGISITELRAIWPERANEIAGMRPYVRPSSSGGFMGFYGARVTKNTSTEEEAWTLLFELVTGETLYPDKRGYFYIPDEPAVASPEENYDKQKNAVESPVDPNAPYRGPVRCGADAFRFLGFPTFSWLGSPLIFSKLVYPEIKIKEVDRRFRELSKELHPDHGGDEGLFKYLVRARDLVKARIERTVGR